MRKDYSSFFHRTLFVVLFMLTFVRGWGQGTEDFQNIPASASASATRTWAGNNGQSWVATDARTDQTLTLRAINIRNGSLTFGLTSAQLASGIGSLTLNAKAPFGSDIGLLRLIVNGVALTPDKSISGTTTTAVSWTGINVATITSIVIEQRTTGSRITIDDVSWTGYSSVNPVLAITGTTAHSTTCIGTPATSQTYTITNSGSTAASGVSVASNNSEFAVSALSSTSIPASGGTATYTVTFTPTAAGARTATVTVTSTTSGSNSPTSSLTGTGTAASAGAVTTNAVGTITARSAVMNGTVTSVGSCPAISERGFVYSQTSANGDPINGATGVTTVPVSGTATGSYTNTPNTLLPSTQYTYKAYVLNGSTYTYGTAVSFTTSPALAYSGTLAHGSSCPNVSAAPITYTITNNSAVTVTGITVSSNNTEFVVGGTPATSLAPSASTNYTVTFTPASSGIMSATISIASSQPTITNLVTGTGTTPVAQAVGTTAATVIAGTAATLNGNVTAVGTCPASIEKGFVYSATTINSDPMVGGSGVTKLVVAGISSGAYSSTVNTLSVSTGYSYKAYIFNGTTYTYGAVQTFTTTTPPVNDLCADAIQLSAGVSATGTTASATFSTNSFSYANSKNDVWYKFVPSCSGTHTINLTFSTPATNDLDIDVFTSATCPTGGAANFTGHGSTASEIITPSLIAGTNYYFRVIDYNLTGIPFTLTVTAPTPTAAAVTTGGVSLNTTGTTATLNASAATLGVCPTTTVKGFVISKTIDNATPVVGGANTVNEVVTPLGSSGAYSKAVTGLSVNTGYSYQAYLYDGTTYTYGGVVTFTTPLVSLATDYFRSNVTSGNWATPATWESSATGGASPSEWMAATLSPTSSATNILIRQGHTITSAVSNTARNLTIEATGTVILNNTFTLNGTNVINGTLSRNSGSTSFTTTGASITFGATGIYNHNFNGGVIPTATWSTTSTCNITGITGTAITVSSLNQTFGNLIWNNTGQTTFVNLDSSVNNFSVLGTFSVLSTGTRAFSFNNASSTAKNYTINNFLIAGTSQVQMSFLTGTNVPVTTLNVLGDLTLQDSAILDFGANTGNGPIYFGSKTYRSIVKLAGNLSASAASSLTIVGNNTSYGVIEFGNTAVKNLTIQNPSTYSVLFEVLPTSKLALQSDIVLSSFNGFDVEGTLDLGTHTITGADGDFNYFYNYPNSTLRIAHPDGIVSLLTYPTTGAVRVDANSEDYDISGNYVYYGTSNQITGNGLPVIVKNISIENTGASGSNEVTLTNAELGVTEDLIINNGIYNINDKEVYGGGIATSDLQVNTGSELKIGGARTFPLEFGTVTFAPLSTIHYAGQDQIIANVNSTAYANLPSYENLKISGTGTKSPVTNLTVNNITSVTAGTLKIMETADDALPNIFTSKKGVQVGTSGNLILANNANLMQDDSGVTNSGNIIAQRIAKLKFESTVKADYNYWSSPVKDQKLLYNSATPLVTSFSPGTPNNRIFEYKESSDTFVATANPNFVSGKGYAIRAENAQNGSTYIADGTPKIFEFMGEPNNGNISTPSLTWKDTSHGYNVIGNPYPSNINFDSFWLANQSRMYSTAYFWTNNQYTPNQQGSGYTGSNYAIYNGTGGNSAAYQVTSGSPVVPNEFIKPGQGFIVQTKSAGILNFNNSMREVGVSPFFNNKTNSKKGRFWLSFTSPSSIVNNILIGYIQGASNGFEKDFDAPLLVEGSDSFFSILGAQKLAIQGRDALFTTDDIVTVGTKYFENGIYKIALAQKEGLFENQNIYLKDKLLNKTINLSSGDYTFTAVKGTDATRFEIVYKDDLVLGTDAATKSDFIVYKDGTDYVIKSSKSLGRVEIYDAAGRMVVSKKTMENNIRLDAAALVSGVYIIKAENSGDVRTKKVIK